MTVWYAGAYAPAYQTVIYFFSLHVSGDYMLIIRRYNCIYMTPGTCYSVWMTVWYAGAYAPYRITSTKCRINTAISPDDGHIGAQNTWRKEINTIRKIVHQVGFIYKIVY